MLTSVHPAIRILIVMNVVVPFLCQPVFIILRSGHEADTVIPGMLYALYACALIILVGNVIGFV